VQIRAIICEDAFEIPG